MQGQVVLHEDVQIVLLTELSEKVRSQLKGEDGDFALTRQFSRSPSKVIDANAASLLRQFRNPRTIVEGILAYSKEAKVPAFAVLEDAYPLIESCLLANLLVEPGEKAEKVQASFAPGDSIDGNTVERSIQALVDSEVYQVRTPAGHLAALKISTGSVIRAMDKVLTREADLLSHIGGAPAPACMGMAHLADGRPYLLTEWFDGDDAQTLTGKLRQQQGANTQGSISAVCASIVDSYAELHERGILHGDVHPRNVLVSEAGEVRIIDFGIARAGGGKADTPRLGGVAFFFEPEYAQTVIAGTRHAPTSFAGEQYSVAALVYSLLCGDHYLDFSFDRDTMLRQITGDAPLPFARHCTGYPPALEVVLKRALQKEPSLRFESCRQFAGAFRGALALAAPVNRVTATAGSDESKILLERVLETISDPTRELEQQGPSSPLASVNYGYAGIAYAAYRIACARDDGGLFALADAWAERAAATERAEAPNAFYSAEIQITPDTVGRVSPFHTGSGVAAVQALLAGARGDNTGLDAALNRYLQNTSAACTNPDLTLGNGSVLLGLILLLESNGPAMPPQLLQRGNELHSVLLDVLDEEPAMGSSAAVSYLGIAHGWAGLLYAMLQWSQLTGAKPADSIEKRLRELAGWARLTRNGARWPVQSTPGSITMPGWCNGSAGYVHLWTLAHRVYGEASYLDLAERAAMDAFEVAGGGHGLCCGFAGQAYAQLNLYKHSGEQRWLHQARILTQKASEAGNGFHSLRWEGLPHSLYKGDVGVAILVAEMEKPEIAAMPFFEAV